MLGLSTRITNKQGCMSSNNCIKLMYKLNKHFIMVFSKKQYHQPIGVKTCLKIAIYLLLLFFFFQEHLMQKDRSYKDEIHRAFRRSESQLRKALKRRKAEVKVM